MVNFLAPILMLVLAASSAAGNASLKYQHACSVEVECLGQDPCGDAPHRQLLALDGHGNAVLDDGITTRHGKEATAIGDPIMRVFFFAPKSDDSPALMLSLGRDGRMILSHHGRYEGLNAVTYFGQCGDI